MVEQLVVERSHGRVNIYGKLGGGAVELTPDQARTVQYELSKMFGPVTLEDTDG